MNYLKDAFQLANDSKQHMEKLKTTVDEQSAILATLVRLSLNAEQNEALSAVLEEIISTCTDCAFHIGYNTALQTFAEGKAMSEPPTFPQQ
jgi:hypothetical protein